MTRAQLALLHTAKRKLGLDDATYRAVLRNHGGVESAKLLDAAGFKRVADYLREQGFAPIAPKPGFGQRAGMASDAQVSYIRGLWRQFAASPDDRALDKWLEHSFKVTALRFLPADRAQDAIEGLKRMIARKAASGQDGDKGQPSPAA